MKEIQFELLGKQFNVKTDDPIKLEKCVSDINKLLRESSLEYKSFDIAKFLLYNILKMSEELYDTKEELNACKNQLNSLDNDIDSILDD
ncbi:MAG: hypothetical protein B6226_00875 [Candidatus Cloacimonetes bacterium 4572_65]|nr:MAG: hypothetical protein B6226_00875 [Candidatus Cloacimonetes bacterium 4572_65]